MTATIGTRRALSYRRVSTAEQAGERHSSLSTQEARIVDYAARHHLALLGSFIDVATGKKDNRLDYQRMVKSCLDGNADVVVVQFLDRFGRNPREILRRVWALQEAGVTVEATDEDIREELMLLIKAGVAGQESKRNGERVRANMSTAARKGVHFGRPPYGYRRIREGDGGDLVTFEQELVEAQAVREMYRLAVEENLGYKSIADRLTAGGYPSRSSHWEASTVRRILTNEALAGSMVFHASPEPIRLDHYFPPILTGAEWQALQARLTIRRESPRGATHASAYLLSGIARCGHCGGPMVGKRSYQRRDKAGNLRQYANYWCGHAQRSRALCAFYNGHAAAKLERAILEHLAQYDDPARVRTLLETQPADTESGGADEVERVERRLAELDADFLANLDLLKRGLLDDDDFQRANSSRKSERALLQSRHAELLATRQQAEDRAALVLQVPCRVRSFLEDVQHLDTRKAKAHLQRILSAAHVYRDGRIELQFRTA